MVSKQNKFVRYTEHFVCLKWRLKKNICQRIASVARLTFVEWRSALKKEEKNFESKYHDVKVKSLKQRSTSARVFSYAEEEKN